MKVPSSIWICRCYSWMLAQLLIVIFAVSFALAADGEAEQEDGELTSWTPTCRCYSLLTMNLKTKSVSPVIPSAIYNHYIYSLLCFHSDIGWAQISASIMLLLNFFCHANYFQNFQFNFKFSNMQLVCYDHSTGCSHWGGEGGFQGLGKKEKKRTKKNNKMGKNFQCGIDLSPRPTRAGGPRVTPPREGSSARDKSTHSGPSWIVDESGRACSP